MNRRSFKSSSLIFSVFVFVLGISLPGYSKSRSSLETVRQKEKEFELTILGNRFAQGNLLILNLALKEPMDSVSVIWNGKLVPARIVNNSIHAALPISPEFSKKDIGLKIGLGPGEGQKKEYEYSLPVRDGNFVETKSKISLAKKYTNPKRSKKEIEFIQRCIRIKNDAFQTVSGWFLKRNFVPPVKRIVLNSPFYKRRIYNNRKGKAHGGTDFRGRKGDPVYAINDGKILIARRMFFEGNFTVIDHGNGILSLYMHQSKILVREGQTVKAGDLIGKIGSTGMSTGPHLHLGLRVRGVLVDPMSVINRDIF